jgi:hypothetical protein
LKAKHEGKGLRFAAKLCGDVDPSSQTVEKRKFDDIDKDLQREERTLKKVSPGITA